MKILIKKKGEYCISCMKPESSYEIDFNKNTNLTVCWDYRGDGVTAYFASNNYHYSDFNYLTVDDISFRFIIGSMQLNCELHIGSLIIYFNIYSDSRVLGRIVIINSLRDLLTAEKMNRDDITTDLTLTIDGEFMGNFEETTANELIENANYYLENRASDYMDVDNDELKYGNSFMMVNIGGDWDGNGYEIGGAFGVFASDIASSHWEDDVSYKDRYKFYLAGVECTESFKVDYGGYPTVEWCLGYST